MERDKKATQEHIDRIIRNHTISAVGVGLIPIAGLDFAGLIVVQSKMIKEIAEIYGVPFFKEAVKNALGALIRKAIFANVLPLLASMAKMIPVFGQGVGMATMPIICGASTYAAGKVFVRHFEAGGTLKTFDPEAVQDYYAEMLEEGKKVAGIVKKDEVQKRS